MVQINLLLQVLSVPIFNAWLTHPSEMVPMQRNFSFYRFKEKWNVHLRAPFTEHQTLTLKCDYKSSTSSSLPCTLQMYLFLICYILHTLDIKRPCTQVSCRIRGLTFGQSKRPNHFPRNSFAVISLPLLPPLCFHKCLHNLVEHFPQPITIRRGKENPALTPQRWCVQKEGMESKLKWFQRLLLLFWSRCLPYYNATVLFFLSFCFESIRFFVNCLGIAQAKLCQ